MAKRLLQMAAVAVLSAAALIVSGLVAPVLANGHSPALYAYPASANYCPAGFQPIILNGVICCGQPNSSVSYSSMMQHPQSQRRYASPVIYGDPTVKGNGG